MKKAFENFIEKTAEKYRVEAFKGERMLSSWLTEDAQKEYMKELSGRSNFLREINWLTVAEPSGKTLFGALDGTTTGRQKDERHRSRLLHRDQYQTQEADSGVFIPWQLIDELTSLQENFEENYIALRINGKPICSRHVADRLEWRKRGAKYASCRSIGREYWLAGSA